MANIEVTIQRIAQAFVQDVVKALVGSSIEEFAQLAGKGARRAAPAAPAPKAAPAKRGRPPKADKADKADKAEKASARGRKPGKRNRRTSDEIEVIKNKVIELIQNTAADKPEGISVSEIAKAIREDIEDITRPIHQAVTEGAITKKGEKRLTRYFPK